MKTSIEYRAIPELRAVTGDDLKIVGYAAVFNSQSKDLGGFRETVAPGAFTRALAERQEVKCLFNHSADHVLGRTGNGTLALVQDSRGLRFECQLDPNQHFHRDLHASIKRGDVDSCSFAFKPAKDGQTWENRNDANGNYYAARTLTDVDLFDVSAVVNPAYDTTSLAARANTVTPEIRNALLSLNPGAVVPAPVLTNPFLCPGVDRANRNSLEWKLLRQGITLLRENPHYLEDAENRRRAERQGREILRDQALAEIELTRNRMEN
jgi:uncharacterized protein